MDRFVQLVLAAARQAEQDSGVDVSSRSRAHRRVDRDRHRRPELVPGLLRHAARPRAGSREPVLDPDDHPQHGRRLGVDRARHEGAADEPDHRVRRLEHGDRRRARRDPARPRRHDVRRRRRGAGHAHGDRRLRRDARALAAQRRPEGRVAAVRQGARRARDRRGGGGARARGARARRGARREDLRRAARLRRLVRRGAHHRARPDRREPGARDEDGARGRGHRADRGRLRQRARDLDAARRLPRRRR